MEETEKKQKPQHVKQALNRLKEERKDYMAIRKQILAETGMSDPAFRYYEDGTTLPRYPTLGKIARRFGVSADYFIYGPDDHDQRRVEHHPIVRFLQEENMRQRRRVEQQEQLTLQIARSLMKEVEQHVMAGNVAAAAVPGGAQLLEVERIRQLQSCSEEVWVAPLRLRDILPTEAGEIVVSPFFHVVVNNLKRGRSYRFLLSRHVPDIREIAQQFRLELMKQRVNINQVKFALTHPDAPLQTTCAYLRLDMKELSGEYPVLAAQIERFKDANNWVGYVGPSSDDPSFDPLISLRDLELGKVAFEILWGKAEKLFLRTKTKRSTGRGKAQSEGKNTEGEEANAG